MQITDACVPVISPYWRLKQSGHWNLLWKYDIEEMIYTTLSPIMGSIISLFNGELSLRHLAMVLQYAHDFDSIEEAKNFLVTVIHKVNESTDAIVNMDDKLTPYIKRYDSLDFIVSPSEAANQKRLKYPLSLGTMFSSSCETNCVYCYSNRRNVPQSRQLPTNRWIEIFREAHSLGIEQIGLSGGDPFFRKDAITLISELIKLEMLFILSTKCHITREKADRLVDIGYNVPINQYIREIQISMDGSDENTADILAGSPGFFHRAIDSIKNLKERGFNFRVKAVLTPFNAPHVYEWIKLMVDLGVSKLHLAAYNRTFYRHHDALFLSQEDRELVGEQYKRAKTDFPEIELKITGFDPAHIHEIQTPKSMTKMSETPTESRNNNIRDEMEQWEKRTHCSGGRSNIVITPDGKVVLCDTIPQEGIFVVGDLSTQSIMDIWNSQKLLDFAYPVREKFVGSACYDCIYKSDCFSSQAGYCFRDSYFNYDTIYAPPPKCPLAPDDSLRME